MSNPTNHHWLPRFLLRAWATGDNKKVMCFYRPHSCVVASPEGTKKLGATEHLYTARWKGYKNPNFVETSLMTEVIDTPAADIHKRMLNDEVQALEFKERDLWSHFMLLLMVRHPAAIQQQQEVTQTRSKKAWVEILTGKTPIGYTQPLDRVEAEAFYEQHFSGSGHDVVLQALLNFLLTSPFLHDLEGYEPKFGWPKKFSL